MLVVVVVSELSVPLCDVLCFQGRLWAMLLCKVSSFCGSVRKRSCVSMSSGAPVWFANMSWAGGGAEWAAGDVSGTSVWDESAGGDAGGIDGADWACIRAGRADSGARRAAGDDTGPDWASVGAGRAASGSKSAGDDAIESRARGTDRADWACVGVGRAVGRVCGGGLVGLALVGAVARSGMCVLLSPSLVRPEFWGNTSEGNPPMLVPMCPGLCVSIAWVCFKLPLFPSIPVACGVFCRGVVGMGHLGASVSGRGSGGIGRGGQSSQQVSRKCPPYPRSVVALRSLSSCLFCFVSVVVAW